MDSCRTDPAATSTGSQYRRLYSLRPVAAVRRAPIRIIRPRRQPPKKIVALSGPERVTEEYATRAGFDDEAFPEPEACETTTAFDARGVLGQSILIAVDLYVQSAAAAEDADIRLRCADQRDAVDEGRWHIARGPGTVQRLPFERHALPAEIDYRDGGRGNGGHAFGMLHSSTILTCGQVRPRTRHARHPR